MKVNLRQCILLLCLAVWIKPFKLFKAVPPIVHVRWMGIRNNDCEDFPWRRCIMTYVLWSLLYVIRTLEIWLENVDAEKDAKDIKSCRG